MQGVPAIYGAGYRDGQWGERLNGPLASELLHEFRVAQPPRRTATAVIAVQTPRLGIPDDREEIATDPASAGLRQAEHGVGGDGRIHCATAAFEYIYGHCSRQRLRGRRHTFARQYGASARESLSRVAASAVVTRHGQSPRRCQQK